MAKLLVLYFAIIELSIAVKALDYLAQQPSFLKPCPIHTNTNPKCLSQLMEDLFSNWKKGVSGLESLGPIDPFIVKRLRLSQQAEGVANIQLELKNASITGMGNTKAPKVSIDPKDYTFDMKLNVPISKLKSAYKIKGRIFLLNLDGRGHLEMELKDIDFTVIVKTKLMKRGEEYFFDIQSLTTDITRIGNFGIHFTNLFNGNKELEDSANELFNSSWQTLFAALRPGITRTFDSIINDRYKRVFNYIPAKYFISDLP